MTPALRQRVPPSLRDAVERSLYLAQAHRRTLISTAGPDALEVLIYLYRGGFDEVQCVRQATCFGADGGRDLLLIGGAMSSEALVRTLARTCRLLREGGKLVLDRRRPRDDATVAAALASRGMVITATVVDLTAGRLVAYTVGRGHANGQAEHQD